MIFNTHHNRATSSKEFSHSPIRQFERQDSVNSKKKKIFAEAPTMKRTKPQIFGEWNKPNLYISKPILSQPAPDLDESSLTVQFLMLEDNEIDEMYYKDENEAEILGYLINQMGKKPSLEIQGTIIENLSRKNQEIKKQLSLKLMGNQHQLNWGYYSMDALSFRVNQCCSRIQRSRLVLKLLRQTHKDLGLKIQQKLKQKQLLELQISNVVKFRSKYQQVIDLLSELNKEKISSENWSLYKIISIKDLVWTQSRDLKYQMQIYYCFNDIRGFIEQQFQQQLEYSYRFFTQNIVQSFVEYQDKDQLYKMVDSMCDYLQYYELNNKSIDLTKQIRTSLQSQFRSILRKYLETDTITKNKTMLKKGVKYDNLSALNKYLTAFLQSFYFTSFSLGLIVQQFQKLLQSNTQTNKQPLLKKVTFQYNIEKNQLWQYIQDKLVKGIRQTKIDSSCQYQDWIKFEALLFKIILIGEELSNLKSYTILFHLKNTLRLIAQGISSQIIRCFSIQKGMGSTNLIKPQYQCVLFNKLDYYVQIRRVNQSTQFLSTLLDQNQIIPNFDQQQQPNLVIESPYNKKEEYYFIVNQFQELLFFAQNVSQNRIDCFLHTIHCFEYYCYLLIRNDLSQQIKTILTDLSQHDESFENLMNSHHHVTNYSKYQDLQQMLIKQIDNIRSSSIQIQVVYSSNCLREILENLTLCFQVYDFIKQSYKYPEDRDLIEQYMTKTQNWLQQLKQLWIYMQGIKDTEIENKQLTCYQIMYKMTQIMHQISIVSFTHQFIKPEEIGQIYFKSYTDNLIELILQQLTKQNKLSIQSELQKFVKQVNGQYHNQQFDCFLRLLDIRNQFQYTEALPKLKILSLKIQYPLLQKEFSVDTKQITQVFANYVNENS